MAATVSQKGEVLTWPLLVRQVQCSTLVAGSTENIAHGGPTGARVNQVRMEVSTQPTSKDPVTFAHLRANNSTTNDTIQVVFDTIPGGSLTGAVVQLFITFSDHAQGGIGS